MPDLEAYREALYHRHRFQPMSDENSCSNEIERCSCGAMRRRMLRDEAEDRWTSAT